METKVFDLKIKLLSPLMHFGDEQSGTMQTLRRMKYLVDGDYIDIPVFSGNALRGILRTLVMNDLLEKLGLTINSISQNLFYTIFNGGSLKSGGIEDMEFKALIRENCPPLILLGSAYGNMMTEGKMKCGILRPICSELNEYNNTQSDMSLYAGMMSEVFHTRSDRLKTNIIEVSDSLETAKQTVQMKYESEVLSAGTTLETEILVENATELEMSCAAYMINLLKKSGHIGGKSAAGYGKISVSCDDIDNQSKLYSDFVSENKDKIIEFFSAMEGILN